MLWAYKTTSRKPIRESLLALTYGMEAIIPTEIGIPTVRTEVPTEASAEAILKDLDTVDELREAAAIHLASYQQRLARWHNQRVKPHTFKAGELILRRVFENTSNPVDGKFQPKWEGPYTVVRARTASSYALSRPDGTAVPRMWNAMHLMKYY